jgi:hypothetical protein
VQTQAALLFKGHSGSTSKPFGIAIPIESVSHLPGNPGCGQLPTRESGQVVRVVQFTETLDNHSSIACFVGPNFGIPANIAHRLEPENMVKQTAR